MTKHKTAPTSSAMIALVTVVWLVATIVHFVNHRYTMGIMNGLFTIVFAYQLVVRIKEMNMKEN